MKLYNGDCLEIMEQLIEEGVRVDFILTDIPYGVINGMTQGGNYKEGNTWDNVIPIQPMFEKMERILREKGTAVLFSQGELTGKLRTETVHNLPFIYSYFWLKNSGSSGLMASKAPISLIEELSVFYKEYDKYFENPLREYGDKIKRYILDIEKASMSFVFRKKYKKNTLEKFLNINETQWTIPTATNYQFLIDTFNIDTLDYFIPYEELVAMNAKYQKVFNLPEGKKSKSNVLQYDKPKGKEAGLHPTQKPVELLEDLILTYTRPGDTVLDFTMGSGSTGVACKNTGREFIGIELNKDYFNIAKERIECGD